MDKKIDNIKNKINVIYVIERFGIGGVETLIYKIARNLDRKFFYPTIIALNDYEDKNVEEQIISSLTKDNIETLKPSGSTKNSRFRKILFIKKNLKEREDFIIHTNSSIINSILATWGKNIPMVHTYHGIGWGKKDRIVYRFFMKKRFKKIVAVSNAVKQDIKKTIGIEESKIEVIYNGIEIEKFRVNPTTKKSPDNDSKAVNLLFLGRLVNSKDPLTLLEAFKFLNFENVKLFIVGDGPLMKQLKEFVVKHNLKEQVVFLGAINNDEVPQILWDTDVFVMSSLSEGLSISLIEALAAAKPLILSNILSFQETLGLHDLKFVNNFAVTKFGTIFKSGNSRGLANAINWMIENRDKWPEFSKNSYERAKDFSISKTVQEYERIYKEILDL